MWLREYCWYSLSSFDKCFAFGYIESINIKYDGKLREFCFSNIEPWGHCLLVIRQKSMCWLNVCFGYIFQCLVLLCSTVYWQQTLPKTYLWCYKINDFLAGAGESLSTFFATYPSFFSNELCRSYKICRACKVITVFEPVSFCVRDQHAASAPGRHRGSSNGPKFMLQWFIWFPELTEFCETSALLRQNPIDLIFFAYIFSRWICTEGVARSRTIR